MKAVRSIIFYIIVAISFVIGTFITIPLAWFSRDQVRTYQTSARIWARMLAWISGIPVKIEGMENLSRNEALVMVANHQGSADILILLAYLPVYFRFIIKKELFKIPFFGWYLRKAGYISVDRGAGDKAHRLMSSAESVLAGGDCILIFPEGTRSKDGKLQEFKRGSLLLAFKAKKRVLPIAISGSFNIMPPKKVFYDIVPVTIKIGEPVTLQQFGTKFEQASEAIHDRIKGMLEAPR
ncbi:MAG TPA: lysophospholipid acyltransferase family protein [Candidatus Omnitrophota bacterium]|nr:lysophospholipid acyltransferase family protein [Candidatus Omnitrophota bacterium]